MPPTIAKDPADVVELLFAAVPTPIFVRAEVLLDDVSAIADEASTTAFPAAS